MTKSLLTLFLLFANSGFLFAQDSTYYSVLWTPPRLHGKAGIRHERVMQYRYQYESVKDSTLLEEIYYDSLGRALMQEFYRDGRLYATTVNLYNGNRLQHSVTDWPGLPDTTVTKYNYDSLERLHTVITFKNGTQTTQTRYVYNQYNQPTAWYRRTGTGKEVLWARYHYRPDRLVERIDVFESDGQRLDFSHLYGYNLKKHVTTRWREAGQGGSYVDCVRTYNTEGQLVRKTSPLQGAAGNTASGFRLEIRDEIEKLFYLPNGLLRERHMYHNRRLAAIEVHLYR